MGFEAEFKAGKKKRANRSAKLKQCKLYARREQWLSHVKKNECKDANMATSPTFPQQISKDKSADKERSQPVATASLEHDLSRFQESSDPVSPTHHQIVNPSRKKCPSNNNISSSGSSYGSCSRSVSDAEEDNEDDTGIDDWEAVADALSITASSDNSNKDRIKSTDSLEAMTRAPELLKQEPDRATRSAWRPDDVFRPHTLPNLLKQQSFPTSMERHYNLSVLSSTPSSCPICYEELDLTDSSFLPCSCGFLLCLFCHKRILEADARCPGCRKQYGPTIGKEDIGIIIGVGASPLSYRLTRSCTVVSR